MVKVEKYFEIKKNLSFPRIPIQGNLDITYRCNNKCRHCWLNIPSDSPEKNKELSLSEIKEIINSARRLGCKSWAISGGEPMLREDFTQILEHVIASGASFSLNSNGTLITPKIAKLLRKKGIKMIALYGATAKVHDQITRCPGSFEAALRGFAYLKEAGSDFIVQLIPLCDNHHQFPEMIRLAESLSPRYRVGAPWLNLSANNNKNINQEIIRQRLSPHAMAKLDRPDMIYEDPLVRDQGKVCQHSQDSRYLFSNCITSRRDFHIDPYGKMSFCYFVKDQDLRYDLRSGNFQTCWETFIPKLAHKIKINAEYRKGCGNCELRQDCKWCPVFSYLEHRRYQSKIGYLCALAKEGKKFKDDWQAKHRRYFKIADIAIQVDFELPVKKDTFATKFRSFQTDTLAGDDVVKISHEFSLRGLITTDFGREIYRKPPWAVYRKGNSWIYCSISPRQKDDKFSQVAVFNHDYSRVRIYNENAKVFLKGHLESLTLLPTDQLLLARILADRQGCYLHACGVDFDGKGLLFVGHSGAGKSTVANLLKDDAKILCDDRMIIRRFQDEFKIYGTWSHGDVASVSSSCVPLKAIIFLKKSKNSQLVPASDKGAILKKLLSCLVRPLVSVEWWEKNLLLIDSMVKEVPCYNLYFQKNSALADFLLKNASIN